MPAEECCSTKVVGGVLYTNIGRDPTIQDTHANCLSSCIFQKVEDGCS